MTSLLPALVIVTILIAQVFIPGFPKEGILLQSGFEYGVVMGSFINWLGMVLAAQVGYEVVLHSVQVGGRFSDLLERYRESDFVKTLENRGNTGLFFIRLIPYAPNDVISLVSGALFLPRRGFVLVSMITALPYAIFFAYLGDVGSEFVDPSLVWIINLALFGVSLLFLLGNYLYRQFKEQSRSI